MTSSGASRGGARHARAIWPLAFSRILGQIIILAKNPIALLSVWAFGSTILGRSFTALPPGPTEVLDRYLFAYVGTQWIHGRIPYVQVWDNKPPGIFALNAAVFSLSPQKFTALAFSEGVFILGCVATIYLLLRRWGASPLAACLAAGATAIASNLSDFNQFGNLTEIYVLWPVVLSMYFFTRSGERPAIGSVFAAGFFSGVGFLFKTVGLAPLLAQSAFLIFLSCSHRIRTRSALGLIVTNMMGTFFAIMPFGIYFGEHHALGEMLNASVTYNIRYGLASQRYFYREPLIVASTLAPVGSLVVSSIAGLVWFLAGKSRARTDQKIELEQFGFFGRLTFFWLLFDLAGVLAGGKNFPHYFLCLVPSLSAAAGLAYWFMTKNIEMDTSAATTRKLIFVLILGPLLFQQTRDMLLIRNTLRLRNILRQQGASSPASFLGPHMHAVANYISQARMPRDTLFIWNYLPLIYFETEMPSPTRLIDAHHLYDSQKAHAQYGTEILQELRKSPPTFIVDATPDPQAKSTDSVYAGFYQLVQKYYDCVYVVRNEFPGLGDLKVFRSRRTAPTFPGVQPGASPTGSSPASVQ